ncbi:MAG: SpoIIE family protein phosphatase [Clostridia bacterium]|nr:SpoIIE family protein phosphatase [Clostridia bacterium]
MKSTVLPLAAEVPEKSTVPAFKLFLAKKGVFIVCSCLLAAISFFSARCTILTYCSPFAAALVCAMPGTWMPAAVIGAAAGYLSAGYEIVPARYLGALILAILLKRLAPAKIGKNPLFAGIAALLSLAVTGIITSLLLDEVTVTLIPYTAESFIAGAAAVFWAAAVQQLGRTKSLSALKETEIACLLIGVFLLILSISYIHIYSLSLASVLACFTILLSAYYGKIGAGALAGIGSGIALGLGSADAAAFAGMSVGGLFAGLGASHSRLLSAVALEAGFAVPLLFGMDEAVEYTPFIEAGIAALAFLLIPKKVLNKYLFFHAGTYSLNAASIKNHAVSRLRFAADALSDVCTQVDEIKEKSDTAFPAKKTAIYINTMHKTCEKCGLKYYCWEKEKAYTVAVFKKIESALEAGEELSVETLPNQFGEVCIRNKVLLKNFTLEHTAYMANRLAAQKADSMREVMSVQFDALSQLLFDLSEDIEQKEMMDAEKTDALIDLLEYCGADYLSAGVYIDKDFHTRVHLRLPHRQEVFEKPAFLEDLQTVCARSFEPPQSVKYENSVALSFYEQPLYTCACGAFQISAQNNRYCGDAYEILKDYGGKCAAVLADGMGSGFAANVNATLSARMIAKLLSSGFSVGSAIKIVNAALMVKDSDESFSCLDLLSVDLFCGKVDFYKAGATYSLVCKNNKITKVSLSGMPVGILETADFSHTSATIGAGDILLLVSDGVTQGNSEWIGEMLLAHRQEGPRALAKAIAQTAAKRFHGAHEDDISVIALYLEQKSEKID